MGEASWRNFLFIKIILENLKFFRTLEALNISDLVQLNVRNKILHFLNRQVLFTESYTISHILFSKFDFKAFKVSQSD